MPAQIPNKTERYRLLTAFLYLLLIIGELGGGMTMRNCLLSRRLCAEDDACRSILEIIPRVCGPEAVACTTVTVNKCLAALRTIRGFPYFDPVCLCREPHLDQNCNAFREFIFDHPCEFVFKEGDGPYAVHALPTCDYAARACDQLPGCRSTYDRFRNACKVREGHCRMEDINECLWAWTQLKQLPMFGCICPSGLQKGKCNKIFSVVHRNPCVDAFLATSAHTQMGSSGVWRLVLPPPTPPRPTSPIALFPIYPYHRSFVPVKLHPSHPHGPHLLSVSPQPPYSAQTHNVLSVPSPPDNTHGSFPVSVIPFGKSSLHGISTQIQSPLINSTSKKGAQNASRAEGVLGSEHRRPSDPYTTSGKSASRLPQLHSTCQTALEGCINDQGCRRLLDPVLSTCNTVCFREKCMDNLQTFYRNVDSKWSLEIAFCLCRKTSSSAEACLEAQEKLHPKCARNPAGTSPLFCSEVAKSCKEDKRCRHRLEFYEQACAVDSDTQKCAGSTGECRRALIGILGTRLRNLCTCATLDIREQFLCADWQRILWINPCVLESFADYHRESLGVNESVTTPSNVIIRLTSTPYEASSVPVQLNGNPRSFKEPLFPPTLRPKMYSLTTTASPTTTSSTTTQPPEYCTKELLSGKKSLIAVGSSRRYYKMKDACSELCQCFVGQSLVCRTLACIPPFHCSNNYAVYTHDAPAYNRSRGRCICYSDDFICARPLKEEYTLGQGVFIFVGYSKKEEEILRPYTDLDVMESVPRLKKLYDILQKGFNGSKCLLELTFFIEENFIMKALLQKHNGNRENLTAKMFNDEREDCEPPLKELSEQINKKHPNINEDVVLSMVLLSEVQSHVPPYSRASLPTTSGLHLLYLCSLIITLHGLPPS